MHHKLYRSFNTNHGQSRHSRLAVVSSDVGSDDTLSSADISESELSKSEEAELMDLPEEVAGREQSLTLVEELEKEDKLEPLVGDQGGNVDAVEGKSSGLLLGLVPDGKLYRTLL